MARRMMDAEFRQQQFERRLDKHMAPINEFVATLRNRDTGKWVPEVAPMHGGIDATLLFVLRDPGPKTQEGVGSGFLCIENDDPTAERQCELFEQFGISPQCALPWNAYPWYINRAPRAAEREEGAKVLCELMDMLPNLRVVLLQGNEAVDVWRRVIKRRPTLVADRGIDVIESIHPGRQALWTPDPAKREARRIKQQRAFERLAEILVAPR